MLMNDRTYSTVVVDQACFSLVSTVTLALIRSSLSFHLQAGFLAYLAAKNVHECNSGVLLSFSRYAVGEARLIPSRDI
jgi:hypothetical protein